MLLLAIVCMWTTGVVWCTRSAGCQGTQDCDKDQEEHCYKNMCLSAGEVMQLAFQIGKPCEEEADCPEACYTQLVPSTCGPYLRSLRLPVPTHEAECHSEEDCDGGEEQCIVRPQGNECNTPAQFMEEA